MLVMLRPLLRISPSSSTASLLCGVQCHREMATLQSISARLKSVKNIQKITQSMKMVSAAKFARAEKELKLAKPFGEASQTFYELAEVTPPQDTKNEIVIAMTSDKGLCGAVHSTVCRHIRAKFQNQNLDNTKLICIGDKARATLQRLFGERILFCAKEIGRAPPVFQDATQIATILINSDYEFDVGTIVYNQCINIASYKTKELPLFSQRAVYAAPKISLYDSLDTDVVQSYMEYSLASQIFYSMKEHAASEQSARMTAMDSSSRNAGEMIGKLQLTFNRTRQAVITRELIEIISGASALE